MNSGISHQIVRVNFSSTMNHFSKPGHRGQKLLGSDLTACK